MKKILTPGFIRAMALVVLSAGAVGSVVLVLKAGRHTPVLLLVLFVGWVLSPFTGFLIADKISKHWTIRARMTLYWVMLIMTIGSLISYSGAFSIPGTKPAFIFLVVPLISWLLMLTIILLAQRLSRQSNKTGK